MAVSMLILLLGASADEAQGARTLSPEVSEAAEASELTGSGEVSRLHLEVTNGDGQGCDVEAQMLEAMTHVLPELEILVKGAPAARDLVVHLATDAEGWSLEIRTGSGEVMLRRMLRAPEGSCPVLAETAALMVERRLQELGWEGLPGQIRVEPPGPPPGTRAPSRGRAGAAPSGAAAAPGRGNARRLQSARGPPSVGR